MAAVAIAGGVHWYRHRPKAPVPDQLSLKVTPPATTTCTTDDAGNAAAHHPSARRDLLALAPIEQVGKTVTHGIELSPALKGEWRWNDDHTLGFAPATDWPARAPATPRRMRRTPR